MTFNYIGLNELKNALGVTDAADDAVMTLAIQAACESINNYCGRRFDLITDTRYYEADDEAGVSVPDVVTITSVKTDEDGDGVFERTWTASDYLAYPYTTTTDHRPYTRIVRATGGDYLFPDGRRLVQVAGQFGYSETPAAVRMATLIWAERLYKRKDAPFGVIGSADMGQVTVIPRLDPDIVTLLAGYRATPWIV